MKFYSKKIIGLTDADIHLHYANNKGRGSDNATVTIVEKNTPRRGNSQYLPHEVIKSYRVSGWRGLVNIPTEDILKYGPIITTE